MTEHKKKPLAYLLAAIVLFYLFHWLEKLFELAPDTTSIDDLLGFGRIDWMMNNWSSKSLLDFQFTPFSLVAGMVALMLVFLLYFRVQDKGLYRPGEEHGSARFITKEELDTFVDEVPENNIIFTQQAQMGLHNRRLPYDKQINKNVVVFGGTGDWKTRSFVKPNAMQRNSSYLFTDTKGIMVHEIGTVLEEGDYDIKIFDLINFTNSDGFNVFCYMKREIDIDRVSEAIISSLSKSEHKGEDFWEQAKSHLVRTLIGYLYFDGIVLGKYMPNLGQVTDLLRNINREDPDIASPVEILFDELNQELPNNYVSKQWQLFNKAAKGRTRESVVYIVSTLFSVFDHDDVRSIIQTDTMNIDQWQLRKTAVFLHIPEADKAYQFLSALFFHTVFETLIKVSDTIIKGTHSSAMIEDLLHFQMYADEAAQIGKIPYLPEWISVIRSREISIKLMVQSLSQMEELYGRNNTKTIINNCGAVLYLGSNDDDTLKSMANRTGPQTINATKHSKTYGQHGSASESTDSLKRELLDYHEVATIAIDEALLYLNKQNVFRDKKYRLETHPQYHLHADSPRSPNWFTYKRYLSDIDDWLENVSMEYQQEVTQEALEKTPLPWEISL